jgi:hypothetical protein
LKSSGVGERRVRRVYVSLFDAPESERGRAIIGEADRWARVRDDRYPLDVAMFDARAFNPWIAAH